MTGSPFGAAHPDMIVGLAARYKLPRFIPSAATSMPAASLPMGRILASQFGLSAGYVDRILKGRSQPTCRCRADQVRVGHQPQDRQGARLNVPPSLLARADEVIE